MSVSEPTTVPASAGRGDPPVTVVILTHNEEGNIGECLASCAWSDDVHVLDSGSTDRTCQIARDAGAHVHTNRFQSFGRQRNWAIDNITHKHDWVFHLDADERFTPELVDELRRVVAAAPEDAGFYVPHRTIFMGRWLRRAEGGYPIYQMRFFHKARMRFRDYGHGQREDTQGKVGVLKNPYLHYNFSKGFEDWIAKHNRYSTLEAQEIFSGRARGHGSDVASPFGNAIERRRFFKARVYPRLPGTWLIRFLWMYFWKRGFLDGMAGLQYCLLMSAYDLWTSLKVIELKRQAKRGLSETVPRPRIISPAEASPAE